ncbi:hypothetical protein N7501_000011 [Penicillium viridicatum]|nr:hypothetical protein N7501_000011 [Penicillium viridicatum]
MMDYCAPVHLNAAKVVLGQSFLTDSRNTCYLDPAKEWLRTRVGRLFRTFWSQNVEGRWVVSADAAQQYEKAVQRFLRVVTVPSFSVQGSKVAVTSLLAYGGGIPR